MISPHTHFDDLDDLGLDVVRLRNFVPITHRVMNVGHFLGGKPNV